MVKMNEFLAERFKKASATLSKITGFSEREQSSDLSGVFSIVPLSTQEQDNVSKILDTHRNDQQETTVDLRMLSSLTAEIKAINCQAAILHGERIKKAQTILKKYRDGAFTEWLIATYGNRQTPYNFLQYYELYQVIPKSIAQKLDEMPRQIAYALASRSGSIEQKLELIKNYAGQSKEEMMTSIRSTFPLSIQDKRAHDPARVVVENLRRIEKQMKIDNFHPSDEQKKELKQLLRSLKTVIS